MEESKAREGARPVTAADFDVWAADWEARVETAAEVLDLAASDGGEALERAALVCAGSLRDTAAMIGAARAECLAGMKAAAR